MRVHGLSTPAVAVSWCACVYVFVCVCPGFPLLKVQPEWLASCRCSLAPSLHTAAEGT